ncbi:MAG: hypothetical protein AB1324_02090 [Candidatus Micrarchaeota archaeon]
MRVYECDSKKKGDLTKVLEADPYADDSFARVGYKVKDGAMTGEDKEKIYVYISASEDFLKKADEKLKGLASPAPDDVQKRVQKKIEDEEDTVAAGVSMFGD